MRILLLFSFRWVDVFVLLYSLLSRECDSRLYLDRGFGVLFLDFWRAILYRHEDGNLRSIFILID